MTKNKISILIHHIILLIFISLIIFMPNKSEISTNVYLLFSIGLIEVIAIIKIYLNKKDAWSISVISSILLLLLLAYEVITTKLALNHSVLMPNLEDIFAVFYNDFEEIIKGVLHSLLILLAGSSIGLILGTTLGFIFGWYEPLKKVFMPIANVLAPIPALVYSPYIIAIMPTFRSASVVVILLSVFWPTFLRSIVQAGSVDKDIVDSARILGLDGFSMIFSILVPYSLPKILSSIKLQFTMIIMTLIFAEMLGSTIGMGYYIINYNTYGNYKKVIAGIIVVGIVVTLFNKIMSIIIDKTIKWRYY